jgi:hypothetical protein
MARAGADVREPEVWLREVVVVAREMPVAAANAEPAASPPASATRTERELRARPPRRGSGGDGVDAMRVMIATLRAVAESFWPIG